MATAFELGGDGFGRTHSMTLVDYSPAGMGAVSQSPIAPGTAISVGFQSPGHPARRGAVSRCLPCGHGYRVAVVFEQRMAA
ncbi:MAG: hypothetical protein HKO59_06115 [Phycisphaerales bacterium]|nr:hypothetical protein [Phycisphaerales bacterium]